MGKEILNNREIGCLYLIKYNTGYTLKVNSLKNSGDWKKSVFLIHEDLFLSSFLNLFDKKKERIKKHPGSQFSWKKITVSNFI